MTRHLLLQGQMTRVASPCSSSTACSGSSACPASSASGWPSVLRKYRGVEIDWRNMLRYSALRAERRMGRVEADTRVVAPANFFERRHLAYRATNESSQLLQCRRNPAGRQEYGIS